MSPLLFATAMEPVAEGIQLHPKINGVTMGTTEFKLALYADDLTLYLTQPQSSLEALHTILASCSAILGLHINYSKLELYPIHLTEQLQMNLQKEFPCKWVSNQWRHLGI